MKIWIQGAGEMASGAAVALLADGHQIVMAEIPNPLAVRRLVCFSEAVYEGSAEVCSWAAVLREPAEAEFQPGQVTVLIDPEAEQMSRLAPDVVVDARMTKRTPAPLPLDSQPLIGLGPGFVCGENADLIVETMRGDDLGQVIASGSALAYTGRPGAVGGRTVTRLLRSPAAGNLVATFAIGDMVTEGTVIGHVSGLPVVAGLSGKLRGLVHAKAELIVGEKVGDVDPRGAEVDPAAMTDKATKVGAGVARAVAALTGQTRDAN